MEEIKTKTGAAINELLEQNGVSIREFAMKMDTSYEFVRRIVRGEALPSKPMLKQMASYFGVDMKQLTKNLVADQILKRYGSIPLELSEKKPGMASIERHWDQLSPEQQKDLTDMAIQWAKRSQQTVKV